MRIAVHVGGRELGGSERQVEILVRGLVSRGHQVAASAPSGTPASRALAEAGATVTGTRPRGDVDPISLARFVAWLRRTRPDALLATSWKRASAVLLAGHLAGVPRIVLRLGGPQADRGHLGDRARAYAMKRWMNAAYGNSTELRDRLRAYAPDLPHTRVIVIPNAIRPVRADPAPLRAHLGLSSEVPLVLSVGGLERKKGVDVLLRAVHHFGRKDAHLVVAGAGPEHAALQRLAAALNVAERVHLLGHRSDVPSLLASCDAFALASNADSTPNAVLEAMGAGLPVVMTATAGAAELLGARPGHPPAGWVVPIGDSAALAGAVDQALTPAAHPRLREASRRVQEEHDPEQTLTLLEALLHSIDPGPPGGAPAR